MLLSQLLHGTRKPGGFHRLEQALQHSTFAQLLGAELLDFAPGKVSLQVRSRPDLWVTCRSGSEWSTPTPIPGDVNSPGAENFMFHSPDGRRLYFVRDFARLYSIPTANLCPASRR